jgi:hypothetical protein
VAQQIQASLLMQFKSCANTDIGEYLRTIIKELHRFGIARKRKTRQFNKQWNLRNIIQIEVDGLEQQYWAQTMAFFQQQA